MSDSSHEHFDYDIIDADEHFTIDTVTRIISNANKNRKVSLMQYDNKSERYSFDIDRMIDGHDLMNCNRVQIHFTNEKHPGVYLVDDVAVMKNNDDKITFSWLISNDATCYNGSLRFLVSFECVEGDKILYRWSTAIYDGIKIAAGFDNDNTIVELYADELLAWQNHMETEFIPNQINELYIEREFATSEEVAQIFGI